MIRDPWGRDMRVMQIPGSDRAAGADCGRAGIRRSRRAEIRVIGSCMAPGTRSPTHERDVRSTDGARKQAGSGLGIERAQPRASVSWQAIRIGRY